MNENAAIAELVGNVVEVRSVSGAASDSVDRGVLAAYDPPFLLLDKGGDDLLVFPLYNVRLVKLVERMG